MAKSYNIIFTPAPGSYGTFIEYKKSTDVSWTVPLSPANPTTLNSYTITIDDGYTYFVRVSGYGGNCVKKYRMLTIATGGPFIWEQDTFYCEQGTPLNLVDSITGFADPYNLGYDQITGRMYVVDASAITQGSNIYWFDPLTISSAGDITPVGSLNVAALASVIDSDNRKIYITGPNTSGMVVYNIATNTVTNIAFGTNLAYGRTILLQSGSTLLSLDDKSLKVTLINGITDSVISSLNYSSIPSYQQYFSGSPSIVNVAGEWWVVASQGAGFGPPDSKIARYNSTFTSLLGTIVLPGQVLWTNSAYWRSVKLINNILFIYDAGSNQLLEVNTLTQLVTSIYTFTNREGKTNSYMSVIQDVITDELYLTGTWTNDANTDFSPINITYKLDGITFQPSTIYPDLTYGTPLIRLGLTDTLIGCYGQVRVYPTNPSGAATDGLINIFDKSSGSDNTGNVIVLTLEEIDVNTGDPTGNTKLNTVGDPDYIAPYLDISACAVAYDLVCPVATFTTIGGTTEYEYSLKPSTYTNPLLDHINLVQIDTVTFSTLATTTVPKNLYQNGTLTKVGANPNRVDLEFQDASNDTLDTCTNIFTIT